jgi:hypothetical protein
MVVVCAPVIFGGSMLEAGGVLAGLVEVVGGESLGWSV